MAARPAIPLDETSLAAHPLRGIKRCLIAGMIVMVIVAGLWTGWWAIAHRRLQTQLDAIRAGHEPIDVGDLDSPPIPPGQNAAPLWTAAFAAVREDVLGPTSPDFIFDGRFPRSPKWMQMEGAAISTDAKVLALARQASQLPAARWPPVAAYYPPVGLQARSLAIVLFEAACYAHARGNDAEALRRFEDMLQESVALDQLPLPIWHMQASDVRTVACTRFAAMVPVLTIADSAAVQGPASRSQIIRMIARLTDERGSLFSSRQFILECRWREFLQGEAMLRNASVLRPMLEMSEARMLNDYAVDLRAAEAPDEVAAAAIYQAAGGDTDTVADLLNSNPRRLRMVDWWRSMQTSVYYYWQGIADRRALVISLAVRLYRIDHHAWPTRLTDLVPGYLAAIPTDPFHAGNKPMAYVIRKWPDGRDRPLLHFGYPTDLASGPLPDGPVFWHHPDIKRVTDAAGKIRIVKILGQWRDLSQGPPVR